jgi:hypothetical protein
MKVIRQTLIVLVFCYSVSIATSAGVVNFWSTTVFVFNGRKPVLGSAAKTG